MNVDDFFDSRMACLEDRLAGHTWATRVKEQGYGTASWLHRHRKDRNRNLPLSPLQEHR